MDRTKLARVAHEINRAYCAAMGDLPEAASQVEWDDAPQAHRDSYLAGVDMHMANPLATPEQAHVSWLAAKEADGWTYGEVKDIEKKQHPCMLPYWDLPAAQRAKDYLFRAVVHSLKNIPEAVQSIVAPAPIDSAFVSVKYIGKRERYVDGAYGSHIAFLQGESKPVPAAIAAKLLTHKDVYAPGDAVELPVADMVVLKPKASEEDDNQDMRDAISRMDEAALIAHAKTHYNVTLNKNMRVENMRAKVTGLFDQYGVK